MPKYEFYYPIEVRYGDLDPQGHVNNAKYLTYMEQARVSYVKHLGLWNGKSFDDFGIILADVHVKYFAPIMFGQKVRIGVRISRLGNKSFDMDYSFEDTETKQDLADGSTVLVAYNYFDGKTIQIPADWRRVINAFENLPDGNSNM